MKKQINQVSMSNNISEQKRSVHYSRGPKGRQMSLIKEYTSTTATVCVALPKE